MKKEIQSPLLDKTIRQLEEIHSQIKRKDISIDEATARITAIKHKIQAVALDWMYAKKSAQVYRVLDKQGQVE